MIEVSTCKEATDYVIASWGKQAIVAEASTIFERTRKPILLATDQDSGFELSLRFQ